MLNQLKESDLPKSQLDIVREIGIENYKALVKLAGGGLLYIPNEKSISKPIRNRIIKERFRGNYKELAEQYGLSESCIRLILKNN